MSEIVFNPGDRRTFDIIGAAMEVHRVLGRGFLEDIYNDALAIELELRKIPFKSQVQCGVSYKGRELRRLHRIDYVCFENVVVEIKASSATSGADQAQVINYLAMTNYDVALLLNFGRPSLEFRRFVLKPNSNMKS